MLKVYFGKTDNVTERVALKAMKKYENRWADRLPGISTGGALTPASCDGCGATIWQTRDDYRTECDKCRKKVGFA